MELVKKTLSAMPFQLANFIPTGILKFLFSILGYFSPEAKGGHKDEKNEERFLPPHIIAEILARLPAQTILSYKRVCKSWKDIVETHEFTKFHLSKSVPGLAATVLSSFVDIQQHKLHSSIITNLCFINPTNILGSAHGLLLLYIINRQSDEEELHVCNPVTREYINLPRTHSHPFNLRDVIYGFGVTKITSQYKVVAIFNNLYEGECGGMVYTIGTGSWRSIPPHAHIPFNTNLTGALIFVNGNLHWLSHDHTSVWICCFDLETELFATFSLPNEKAVAARVNIFAVEGRLCLCEYTYNADAVTIWLMKEYGVEKSWTKEFVITTNPYLRSIYPVKISKDGVMLMTMFKYGFSSIFCYSGKDNTINRVCIFSGGFVYMAGAYTLSLVSLKRCFGMENPISF